MVSPVLPSSPTAPTFPLNVGSCTQKIIDYVHIFAVETLATFRHVLPCAVSWWITKHFDGKMSSFSFPLTIDKTERIAELFLYEPLSLQENEQCKPVLLIHGDHSYPFSLQHLAKIALQNHRGPVFSLYIPNVSDEEHFNEQAAFVDTVICEIKKMVEDKGGVFQGVLGVGHSKGAMLLVERQFHSEDSSKILRTFAVGAPLRDEGGCFQEPLKTIFDNVQRKIQEHPERKFFQVISDEDWVAPYQAMAVRPTEHCYSVPGMHLSGLYSQETKDLFRNFLEIDPGLISKDI